MPVSATLEAHALRFGTAHAQRDAALRRELEGVAEQVVQHLPQPHRVPVHGARQRRVQPAAKLQPLFRGARVEGPGHRAQQLLQRKLAGVQFHAVGLDA